MLHGKLDSETSVSGLHISFLSFRSDPLSVVAPPLAWSCMVGPRSRHRQTGREGGGPTAAPFPLSPLSLSPLPFGLPSGWCECGGTVQDRVWVSACPAPRDGETRLRFSLRTRWGQKSAAQLKTRRRFDFWPHRLGNARPACAFRSSPWSPPSRWLSGFQKVLLRVRNSFAYAAGSC